MQKLNEPVSWHRSPKTQQEKKQGVTEGSDNLNYIGNCTDDDVIEHIFSDATGFAQAVEEYGDEFTLDDLVVKYDPKTDVHSFYYKKQGSVIAEVTSNPTKHSEVRFSVSSQSDFERGFTVSMTVDGKPAGSFKYYMDFDEGAQNSVEIHSDYRRRGYGTLLLLKAIETAVDQMGEFQSDIRGITAAQEQLYHKAQEQGLITSLGLGTYDITDRGLEMLDQALEEKTHAQAHHITVNESSLSRLWDKTRKHTSVYIMESVELDESKVPAGMKFIASYDGVEGKKGMKHTYYRKGNKMTDPVVVHIDGEKWKEFASLSKAKRDTHEYIKQTLNEDTFNDNFKKCPYDLSMIRGKKAVYIGSFPSEYRAKVVANGLGWDASWKPKIEKNSIVKEEAPKVRAKSNPKNLPSTYDESRERSWKKHSKTQFKEQFSFLNNLEELGLLEDLIESVGKPPYDFNHRVNYDYGVDHFDGEYEDEVSHRHVYKLERYGKLGQRLASKLRAGEPVENLLDEVNEMIVKLQSAGKLDERNRAALKSLLDLLWKMASSNIDDSIY